MANVGAATTGGINPSKRSPVSGNSAETRGEESTYYERWLRSFEGLLIERGILTRGELDDRTEEFEFGERDEVF